MALAEALNRLYPDMLDQPRELWSPDRKRFFIIDRGNSHKKERDGDWNLTFQRIGLFTESSRMYAFSNPPLAEMFIKRYSDGTVIYQFKLLALKEKSSTETAQITDVVLFDDDGVKQVTGGSAFAENKRYIKEFLDGYGSSESLPTRIDTRATIEAFVSQVERGDFNDPQLILPSSA